MRSFFKQLFLYQAIACILAISAAARALPELPSMPAIPQPLPLGALTNSPEVKLDLPIASGRFAPTRASAADSLFISDLDISQMKNGSGPLNYTECKGGAVDPSGQPIYYKWPHRKGNLPLGGHVGAVDGHVQFKLFRAMSQRAAEGGSYDTSFYG